MRPLCPTAERRIAQGGLGTPGPSAAGSHSLAFEGMGLKGRITELCGFDDRTSIMGRENIACVMSSIPIPISEPSLSQQREETPDSGAVVFFLVMRIVVFQNRGWLADKTCGFGSRGIGDNTGEFPAGGDNPSHTRAHEGGGMRAFHLFLLFLYILLGNKS